MICEAKLLDDSEEMVKVYSTERAYLAPKMATSADERGVRISKMILQREIPQDQAIKLFVEGKTELMPGFISKKGRKFAAHLTLDRATGKLGFEFAERKSAKKKKADGDDGDDGDDKAPAVKKKKPAAKKKSVKKKSAAKKKSTTKKKAAKEG